MSFVISDGIDSVRVLADGSTEEAGWLDVDGQRIFSVTRVPRDPPRAWLLLCSAIGGEHDGGYRRQTMLARALSPLGIATLRFHYRGTGNSGLLTDAVRDTMVDDAVVAACDMAARFPDAEPMLLGERVGALVAAPVAHIVGARHLILWHPVTDIEVYRRELLRAAELQKVATGAGEQTTAVTDFKDQYEAGVGDLIGFSVSKALLDSFVGHPLVDHPPGSACVVHWMQFGRKRIDPRSTSVIDRWQEAGTTVEPHLVSEPELWWFAPGPWKRGEEGRPVTVEIVETTVGVVERIAWADGRTP